MTFRFKIWMIGALCVLLSACKGDAPSAGQGMLEEEDEILVRTDTFDLESSLRPAPRVVSLPDSMLVGEIETPYGTLVASALTQLSCPIGFTYPETSEIDSICVFLYYDSWIGDGLSPLALSIYEIDKQALEYTPSTPYYTDIAESDYCSFSDETVTSSQRIVLAGRRTDSVYSSSTQKYMSVIRFKMDDNFVQRFSEIRTYPSQEEFNNQFKGLLLKSDFGSSTILNISTLSLNVYYHFSYRKADASQDTTVNDVKGFYASREVRQVNCYTYPDGTEKLAQAMTNTDTCYIVAPAGVYTKLKFPMGDMKQAIISRLGDTKRPYVNLAELRIDVLTTSEKGNESWLQPANQMLLMKDSTDAQIEEFFNKHNIPDDRTAILSALTKGVDSEGNDTYYYTYDISNLLTAQLREKNMPDTLIMTLVPVEVEKSTNTNGSTYITSVKQSLVPSATMVRSAQSKEHKTRLNVVYSGF